MPSLPSLPLSLASFAVGIVIGLSLTVDSSTCTRTSSIVWWKKKKKKKKNDDDNDHDDDTKNHFLLPEFARQLEDDKNWEKICLREWEDVEWRRANGWIGNDFCHNNTNNTAIRILNYYVDAATQTQMVGVVFFGPDTESHRGLCHGGAMAAVMDDFCGHMAFVNTTKGPWSGATVQLNISLQKPVPIFSILRIHGKITKKHGRKIYIDAILDDGCGNIGVGGDGGVEGRTKDGTAEDTNITMATNENDKIKSENKVVSLPSAVVYATLQGLSIEGVQLTCHTDTVANRKWEKVYTTSGKIQRRDSGWK